MTICFFGNYISDYPRIRVLTQGLRENGVRVLECHTRKRGLGKYWSLFRQHWKLRNSYDVLLVGMGGQTLVWFARILCRKQVVFDAFTSLYLTNVEDRKTCSPKSWRAGYYAALDRWSCKLADKVLLDTNAQIDYFISRYSLPREKFFRIFVGADNKVYYPQNKISPSSKFVVHWHGHIVPFHGLNTVIAAAEALAEREDIEFQIVTRFNAKFDAVKKNAESKSFENVRFLPEMSQEELA
ncbi:MAG: hypothetical protein Q8N81_07140, partial [bacterium]|nr:hypothetical protein [bacterium]